MTGRIKRRLSITLAATLIIPCCMLIGLRVSLPVGSRATIQPGSKQAHIGFRKNETQYVTCDKDNSIYAGSWKYPISVWSAATGTLLFQIDRTYNDLSTTNSSHASKDIASAQLSGDGSLIAVHEAGPRIVIIDIDSRRIINEFVSTKDIALCYSFVQGGQSLLVASDLECRLLSINAKPGGALPEKGMVRLLSDKAQRYQSGTIGQSNVTLLTNSSLHLSKCGKYALYLAGRAVGAGCFLTWFDLELHKQRTYICPNSSLSFIDGGGHLVLHNGLVHDTFPCGAGFDYTGIPFAGYEEGPNGRCDQFLYCPRLGLAYGMEWLSSTEPSGLSTHTVMCWDTKGTKPEVICKDQSRLIAWNYDNSVYVIEELQMTASKRFSVISREPFTVKQSHLIRDLDCDDMGSLWVSADAEYVAFEVWPKESSGIERILQLCKTFLVGRFKDGIEKWSSKKVKTCVEMVNVRSGEVLGLFPNTIGVGFSSSGRTFVSVDSTGQIFLWDSLPQFAITSCVFISAVFGLLGYGLAICCEYMILSALILSRLVRRSVRTCPGMS